jgi:pyrimidine-specific ribonucleoside hydrolase
LNANVFGRPLVIDTDVGIDDSMAIAYLLYHHSNDVKAITIVADGSHCAAAYNNLHAIRKYFGYPYIPMACGQNYPIVGRNHYSNSIIDFNSKYAAAGLKKSHLIPKKDAVELLYHTIHLSTESVDLLAIGPLTNIAALLKKHPDIQQNIHQVWIMGGAVNVMGNVVPWDKKSSAIYSEWNFYLDPTAAEEVFASQLSIILIPLDVTNQVPLDQQAYELFKKHQNNAKNRFIFKLIMANYAAINSSNSWYFWDPLAAVLMKNPSLADCHQEKVKVVPFGSKIQEGRVLADENGHSITICDHLKDPTRFFELLSQ